MRVECGAALNPLPHCGRGWRSRVAGKPGEGLSVSQRFQNHFDNPFGIGEHVIVPEANDAPTLSFEKGCSALIRNVLGVLAAIDLNDEVMLGASEIGDESADRVLTAESESGQSAIAQRRP